MFKDEVLSAQRAMTVAYLLGGRVILFDVDWFDQNMEVSYTFLLL